MALSLCPRLGPFLRSTAKQPTAPHHFWTLAPPALIAGPPAPSRLDCVRCVVYLANRLQADLPQVLCDGFGVTARVRQDSRTAVFVVADHRRHVAFRGCCYREPRSAGHSRRSKGAV